MTDSALAQLLTLTSHGKRNPEASRRGAALPQFAGKQAEHDGVASPALERNVRAQDALTREPAPLRNALGGAVVGAARQLQPGETRVIKSPAAEEPDGVGRHPVPTSVRPQPIADRRPPLFDVDV